MPVTKAPPLTWRAGADRISHASARRAPRTLCGELVVIERFAWPAWRRCMACESVATGLGWRS